MSTSPPPAGVWDVRLNVETMPRTCDFPMNMMAIVLPSFEGRKKSTFRNIHKDFAKFKCNLDFADDATG